MKHASAEACAAIPVCGDLGLWDVPCVGRLEKINSLLNDTTCTFTSETTLSACNSPTNEIGPLLEDDHEVAALNDVGSELSLGPVSNSFLHSHESKRDRRWAAPMTPRKTAASNSEDTIHAQWLCEEEAGCLATPLSPRAHLLHTSVLYKLFSNSNPPIRTVALSIPRRAATPVPTPAIMNSSGESSSPSEWLLDKSCSAPTGEFRSTASSAFAKRKQIAQLHSQVKVEPRASRAGGTQSDCLVFPTTSTLACDTRFSDIQPSFNAKVGDVRVRPPPIHDKVQTEDSVTENWNWDDSFMSVHVDLPTRHAAPDVTLRVTADTAGRRLSETHSLGVKHYDATHDASDPRTHAVKTEANSCGKRDMSETRKFDAAMAGAGLGGGGGGDDTDTDIADGSVQLNDRVPLEQFDASIYGPVGEVDDITLSRLSFVNCSPAATFTVTSKTVPHWQHESTELSAHIAGSSLPVNNINLYHTNLNNTNLNNTNFQVAYDTIHVTENDAAGPYAAAVAVEVGTEGVPELDDDTWDLEMLREQQEMIEKECRLKWHLQVTRERQHNDAKLVDEQVAIVESSLLIQHILCICMWIHVYIYIYTYTDIYICIYT